MSSILSADPTESRFAQAIKDLESEARANTRSLSVSEGELPQVHALNSLKDIFRTTKLGQSSEQYIERGFDLVGHCLNSDM